MSFLQRAEILLRRLEPSKECPYCGYLMHGGHCDVCGENPENVIVRDDQVIITCHKCMGIVDGLKSPFSCECR